MDGMEKYYRKGMTIHMGEPVYYTVGGLSQAYGLPSSALRFYDKRGLFVPEYRNPQNGYRYYSSKQLIKLDVILFLLELGVSTSKVLSVLSYINSREDLVAVIREYSEELENQCATILARRNKVSEIVKMLPMDPPALGAIEEKLFPERLLYCHKVLGLTGNDGEWRPKFKQLFNNHDPRQNLPVEMLSMGAISSMAQFERDGVVIYKYLYREGSAEDRDKNFLPITLPAGRYLISRFSNDPYEHRSTYIHMLQYLEENNLHTGDMVIESFTVISIPPITNQEDIIEIQLCIE